MRKFLLLVALTLVANVSQAAPLQLKNRIVFTRGALSSQDETVWTMNSDGGDQKRVWRVPKGYGKFGGFSRDGKMVLSFNRFNLYLHNLQTKHFERILLWSDGWGTNIQQPTFSPDGKQILVEIGSASNNSSDTRILRLQTGKSYLSRNEIENVTIHPTGQNVSTKNLWSEPRWSQDGKQIIAVGSLAYYYPQPATAEAQSEIWMMNADGTQAQQITKNPAYDSSPSWNGDGRKIAFVRVLKTDRDPGEYSYNFFVKNLPDDSERALTFFPNTYLEMIAMNLSGKVSNPLFSPDSTQLAFEQITRQMRGGERWSAPAIYRIDADGKNQKRLSYGHLIQWIW